MQGSLQCNGCFLSLHSEWLCGSFGAVVGPGAFSCPETPLQPLCRPRCPHAGPLQVVTQTPCSPGGAPPLQPTPPLLSQAPSLKSRLRGGLGALWVQPRNQSLWPVPWELSRVPVNEDTRGHEEAAVVRRGIWRWPGSTGWRAVPAPVCSSLLPLSGAEVLGAVTRQAGGGGTSPDSGPDPLLWERAVPWRSRDAAPWRWKDGAVLVATRRSHLSGGGCGMLVAQAWIVPQDPGPHPQPAGSRLRTRTPVPQWRPCGPEPGVSSTGPSCSSRVVVP